MKTPSLETALYTGQFDDGLLDLCVGLGLLGVGVSWLSGLHVYGAILPGLLIPVWLILRRRLTEPRLGRVEFSRARRRSERSWLMTTFALGCGVLALAVAVHFWVRRAGPTPAATALVPLLPAGLLALGLVLVATVIGAPRFGAYALTLVGLAVLITWLGGEPGAYMAASGGLLCLWAGTLVARFLSEHPILDDE